MNAWVRHTSGHIFLFARWVAGGSAMGHLTAVVSGCCETSGSTSSIERFLYHLNIPPLFRPPPSLPSTFPLKAVQTLNQKSTSDSPIRLEGGIAVQRVRTPLDSCSHSH